MRRPGPGLGALTAIAFLLLEAVAGAAASDSGPMPEAELLLAATREWGTDGTERKKLRESMATLQKNLERVRRNLEAASEALDATTARVAESGVLAKLDRIEPAMGEARERVRARWELEHLARAREREQREREAAERARMKR